MVKKNTLSYIVEKVWYYYHPSETDIDYNLDEKALDYVIKNFILNLLSERKQFLNDLRLIVLENIIINDNKEYTEELYGTFLKITTMDEEEKIYECLVSHGLLKELITNIILNTSELYKNYYDYEKLETFLKNSGNIYVFEQLHPNISEEENNLLRHRKDNKILNLFIKVEIENPLEFYFYLQLLKQMGINNEDIEESAFVKLRLIKENNLELYKNILVRMLATFYLYYLIVYSNQKSDIRFMNEEFHMIEKESWKATKNILEKIKSIKYVIDNDLDEENLRRFINAFINYNQQDYSNDSQKLNESQQMVLKKLEKLTD